MRTFLLAVALACAVTAFSQPVRLRPALALQSGFNANIQTFFRISAGNKYLYAYNAVGEFILWELRSGRQIKHINPIMHVEPDFVWTMQTAISNDERYILIPQFPEGNYLLYDIVQDSVIHIFKPTVEGDKLTHAFFSADSKRILLISQEPGADAFFIFLEYDLEGRTINAHSLNIPALRPKLNLLAKAIVGFRTARQYYKTASLLSVAVTPDLKSVYFGNLSTGVYGMDIGSPAGKRTESDCFKLDVTKGYSSFSNLAWHKGKLLIESNDHYEDQSDGSELKVDTVFIVDPGSRRTERRVLTSFLANPSAKRSNSATTEPLTASQDLSTYFTTRILSPGHFELTAKDILTDQPLFTYESGEPYFYFKKEDYKPGRLNGGYIVALSADRTIMAECTRELVIHDVVNKRIPTWFSLIRGNFRLMQPTFLDSTRVLIPKSYNDAFVMDLKTGLGKRLDRSLNCYDTARNGANVYFPMDPTSYYGVETCRPVAGQNSFVLANQIPYDLCDSVNDKHIQVWQKDSLRLLESFAFHDREYTYHLSKLPVPGNLFLVNYKLVHFHDNGRSTVHELKIIQKKDTFVAANPFYLPKTNTLLAILGTRAKPGHPDLYFGEFDLEGRLLRSKVYKRKKTPYEYQTAILRAELSPDSTKMLFVLEDGTTGIVDRETLEVLHTYHYGGSIEILGNKKMETASLTGGFMNDRQFITISYDGYFQLWNVDGDKPVRAINKEPSYFYAFTISPDKKYLVGVDFEKTVWFINIATGNTDFRFFATDADSYALVGNDGYYLANKQSLAGMNFSYGGRSYEFSQFDLTLNRPDIVLSRLGYASPDLVAYYRKAWERRLGVLGWKPASFTISNDHPAPELELTDLPAELKNITTRTIALTVKAVDYHDPLSRLLVSVNGVPLYGSHGMALNQTSPGFVRRNITVPLSNGDNRIEVSVVNNQAVESVRENLRVTCKAPGVKPDLYIVAIGSGQFQQKDFNLKYPVKDAKDVTDLFHSRSDHFGRINTLLLQDVQVTRAGVQKLKAQLLQSKPDDWVILFYAGHGIRDNQYKYFLSTYNTDFAKPQAAALPYEELEGILDSIPARNKVLLLDACNSGELDRESARQMVQSNTRLAPEPNARGAGPAVSEQVAENARSFDLMRTLFADLRSGTGASVLASAGAVQPAAEGDQWQNGVFTHCLVTGLRDKKADLNGDGKIRLSELLEYLQQNVGELTHGRQGPVSRAENIVNDLVIWD